MGAVWRRSRTNGMGSKTSAPASAAVPTRSSASPEGLLLRPADAADTPAIIDLLCLSLGWEHDDRHSELFEWKHRDNPFGRSPAWVAVDDRGIVGVRIFMRWGFVFGEGSIQAVRAVDTATHPRARGLGIFKALTLRGVAELKEQGVHWVFNTPNDQSLPGYLSMGWQRLGRLPVALRPASIGVAPRLVAARVPADLWSVPTSVGEDAASVLSDEPALEELLGSQLSARGHVQTVRSTAFVRWRYGSGPVGYRAMLAGPSIRDGVVFFRLRRRGPAVEVAIAEALVPGGDIRLVGRLGRRVLEASRGDYAIAVGHARPPGWLRLRRVGPLLTWRPLAAADAPPIENWDLNTGDVELF